MTRLHLRLMMGSLALTALLATGQSVSASMMISPSESLALFGRLSDGCGMAGSSSMGQQTPTRNDPSPEPVSQRDMLQQWAATLAGNSGMSSSAGGATGTGASVSPALPVSSLDVQRDSLSSRLADEARLILPSSHLLRLLRPPQYLS